MLRNRIRKSWWCKLGFHKFEEITETDGYVDLGDVILRNEQTKITCTRSGCNKVIRLEEDRWIEFKKKSEE